MGDAEVKGLGLVNMDDTTFSVQVPFMEADLATYFNHIGNCQAFKHFLINIDCGMSVLRAFFYPVPFRELEKIVKEYLDHHLKLYLNHVQHHKFVIAEKKAELNTLMVQFRNSRTCEQRVTAYIAMSKVILEATIAHNVHTEQMREFFEFFVDGVLSQFHDKAQEEAYANTLESDLFLEDTFKKEDAIRDWFKKLSSLYKSWEELTTKQDHSQLLRETLKNCLFCTQVLHKSVLAMMTFHPLPICSLQ